MFRVYTFNVCSFSCSFSDSPSGKPKIMPNHLSRNKGQEVLLSCETDDLVDANPRCNRYIWDKINKNDNDDNRIIVSNKSRDSRWLNIFMSEKFEGKYRCKCANDFGESEFSDVAVLWLRNTTAASEFVSFLEYFNNTLMFHT